MKRYQVKMVFTEPVLGTASQDPDVYRKFIAGKAPEGTETEDEIESVPEMLEKGTTGFHRDGDTMIFYDYMIRGFFKSACGMLRRESENVSSKLRNYKKLIDGLVFVAPRRIPIQGITEVTFNVRPLRAQTAQGERIALSRSEQINAGSWCEFQIMVLSDVTEAMLREWLEYGQFMGMGQWRSASYGRFNYTMMVL